MGGAGESGRAGRKLASIIAILLIPILLLGYFVLQSSVPQIRNADQRVLGARYLARHTPVFFALAWENEPALRTALGKIDQTEPAVNFTPKLQQSHTQFIANARNSVFDRRQLLAEARDLGRRIASETGILLDENIARHFLAEAFVKQLPDLVVLAHSGTAGTTLDRFNGEFTALQNASFEAISTAIKVDQSGTFPGALNVFLSGLDEQLETYKEAIATIDPNDDKVAYEAFLTSAEAFMMTSASVMETSIEADSAAMKRTLALVTVLCGLAALAAMYFASRMFYSTFHKLDEVEVAYHKLEVSEAQATALARQLTDMNNDIAGLNMNLAENFRVLKETQDDNIKKSRMAQIGSVTAMVAHELRNPLGAVRNSIFLIGKKAGQSALDIAKPVERINNAVLRCDAIITQLLEFTSAKPLAPVETVIDDWLAAFVEPLAAEIPPHVVVTCDLGLGNLAVAIDRTVMERALGAVVRNAAQALTPAANAAAPVQPAEIAIRTARERGGVAITIRDTGPGIAAENLGKVLEPLFTTKSFGPGLGLPIASRILEQHGGSLAIASPADGGTLVTLWIPQQRLLAAVA